MRTRRASYWLLVAIAVMMVLGHICAEPFHAHAGVITTHEPHDDAHHHPGNAETDTVHAASCDAVKTTPDADGVAVLVAIDIVPIVAPAPERHLVEAETAAVSGSPPLFLLHGVFLI